MKESVALAKDADTKKDFSSARSDNSIHRVRNEPERQLGSLRSVIGNIRHDGGTPSIDSIATELSSMHTAQRASVLLALQRTHGNRYVQRVVTRIQAKLKVGQPGDVYEQEADRVAEQVMRMPEPRLQRQAEEEEEEETLQTKPLAEQITPLAQRQLEPEEEDEENLQTKEVPGQTPEVTSDLESRIRSLKGSGRPLPESVRTFFEPRFGRDFSRVRVHTGTLAADTAQAANARAFTVGHDVVFGKGQYAPETDAGRRLLAHEFTHVVQQSHDKPGSSGIAKNISSSPEPRVSRWKIEGNIATVEKKGDTLWALAKRITGDGRDWPFIKKIEMQSPKAESSKYWLYLWIGDTFDISDLLASTPALRKAEKKDKTKPEKIILEEKKRSWEELTPEERKTVWKALIPVQRNEVWKTLTHEERETFWKTLTPDERNEVWKTLPPDERKEFESRYLQKHGYSPFMLGKNFLHVSELTPEMTKEEIWNLVWHGQVSGVPITADIRNSKDYRKLLDENFFFYGFYHVLKIAPISIAEKPFGGLIESIIAAVEPKDRPTVELLNKCIQRTDLEARYYIILERLKKPKGEWSITLVPPG